MKPIRLPIAHIDRKRKVALVKTKTGKKFPVKMEMDRCFIQDVRLGDDAIVTKSAVTGEWIMIDYKFNNEFNYAVHNSMQTRYEDMIVDEEGVPYGY